MNDMLVNSAEEQIAIIANVIKEYDMAEFASDDMQKLIRTILFKNPEATIDVGLKLCVGMMQLPTAMFWEKIKRFLKGTFSTYDEQVKFAAKFSEDNVQYRKYIKQLINIISWIESDEKIDYFANLTRCFFLFDMDIPLYFRLASFFNSCTSDELAFVKNIEYGEWIENNAIVSMLKTQGIIMQKQDEKKDTHLVLSPFGVLLKKCSLNFDENDSTIDDKLVYEEVACIPDIEPVARWS